jgi:DNA-directed RNA polymerase subunit alpha
MEIEVQKGLGYVPVEQQERETKEIGLIAIDAVFTPVRRVNYTVENTRVGKRTDFDKITIEIETDGSISPKEAYDNAIQIISNQFDSLKNFEAKVAADVPEEVKAVVETSETEGTLPDESLSAKTDVLEKNVESLSLSTRTLNVLEKSNLKNIGDLIALSTDEIMNLEGMGAKGIKEIKKAIGNFGFTLKA